MAVPPRASLSHYRGQRASVLTLTISSHGYPTTPISPIRAGPIPAAAWGRALDSARVYVAPAGLICGFAAYSCAGGREVIFACRTQLPIAHRSQSYSEAIYPTVAPISNLFNFSFRLYAGSTRKRSCLPMAERAIEVLVEAVRRHELSSHEDTITKGTFSTNIS